MFNIIEAPIKNALTNEIIPNRKGLFVDNQCINVVSAKKYKVVQPSTIMELFQKNTKLEITKQISNKNYGSILLGAHYKDVKINNEEHRLNLTCYTGHNNQYSSFVTLMAMRVACMNQLTALIGQPNMFIIRCKHIQDFDFEQLEEVIETLPLRVANFEAHYQRLHDSKLSLEDFLESYVEFFKLQESSTKDKKVNHIRSIYNGAKGQDIITNDTAYKAFHALTYQLTHETKQSINNLEKVNIQNQKKVHDYFKFLQANQVLAA